MNNIENRDLFYIENKLLLNIELNLNNKIQTQLKEDNQIQISKNNVFNNENINILFESILSCKWLIIYTSCLFISLISWDIVSDEEGWNGSIWVPITGIGVIFIFYLINYRNK